MCLLTVLVFPMALSAQNLIENSGAELDLANWNKTQVQVVTVNPHSGKNCFKTLIGNIQSSELIPVDTSKKYKISCWIRSVDDKKTFFYMGLVPFDADKIQILPVSVNAVIGSEAELAEACKADDVVLKIKDASKWIVKDKFNHIAFETDNSGAYEDIPNTKFTRSIVKVENKDGLWEATLDEPCGNTYPANTSVRLQKDGPTYILPIISANFSSSEWKEFSAEVNGEAKYGSHGTQFWAKTKYVKIVILAQNGGMLYLDDLKFEEVK